MQKKQDIFTRFTTKTSEIIGRPWVFVVALIILLLWAVSGPLLGFSETWQLVINTTTTIITFLMVFIIQNTQNRDTLALHLLEAALDLRGPEPAVAAERADGVELAGPRPARDGLRVDPEHRSHFRGREECFGGVEIFVICHESVGSSSFAGTDVSGSTPKVRSCPA